jgi:hypothetical protein
MKVKNVAARTKPVLINGYATSQYNGCEYILGGTLTEELSTSIILLTTETLWFQNKNTGTTFQSVTGPTVSNGTEFIRETREVTENTRGKHKMLWYEHVRKM